MTKQRIHWIDATKGILILLMVLGHVVSSADNHGGNNTFLKQFMSFSSLYSCFFMQAFIILSGYTSNFDKTFKAFSISLVKTILLPWMAFSIIGYLYRVCIYGDGAFYIINGQKYFFLIEDYWFLQVLFFGKIIYWVFYKYIKMDLVRALILLSMMFVGFSRFAMYDDMNSTYHFNNYLHYKDILCMTFFLWLGDIGRRKHLFNIQGKPFLVVISLYMLGHLLRLFLRIKGIDELWIAPVVISHGGNAINPVQIFAYLYYVVFGSLSCFGIMQYLDKCCILEYFGRNSLVVYCVHFIFLDISAGLISTCLPLTSVVSILLYIICTLALTLLGCSVFIYLTGFKPFRYLIGKF